MWKVIDSSLYSTSLTDDGTIKIYVTDFVNLWHVHFSQEQFLIVLRDANSSLSGNNDEAFITKGKEILKNPENLRNVEITPDEESLSVFIVKSYGYPFRIRLQLLRSSKELFFEIVTKPLLETVHDLRNSETELRDLLIKKDKEIERYKRENIKVLQYLKTPAFNEEKHKQQHKHYEDIFGTSNVIEHTLAQKIQCPEEQIKVEVKEEIARTRPTDSTSQEMIPINTMKDVKKEEIKVENNLKIEISSQEITPRKKRKKLNI